MNITKLLLYLSQAVRGDVLILSVAMMVVVVEVYYYFHTEWLGLRINVKTNTGWLAACWRQV